MNMDGLPADFLRDLHALHGEPLCFFTDHIGSVQSPKGFLFVFGVDIP